jgi:hypothetical protein
VTKVSRVSAVALAALAVAGMLAIQGCDAEMPAQAATAAHPDVTYAQAATVYQNYLSASDAGADQADATTGLSVVADAAWSYAHSQYTILANTGTAVPRYVYGTPTYYVPIASGYPHWFVVSVPRRTLGSSQQPVTTLMVFGQSAAHGTWTLDGAAALLPGQTVPKLAADSDGYYVALSPYDSSLLLQPNVVGGTQAAVVDEGPASEAATVMADGPETTGIYSQQQAINAATPKDIEYTWYLEGATFPVFALRTVDGGALVLYGMYLNTQYEHPDGLLGSLIPVPAGVQQLFTSTGEVADHGLVINSTYEFAAIDPPGSAQNAKAAVIAVTGGLTYTKAY